MKPLLHPFSSIRGRILLQLVLGAAVLSLVIFLVFRGYARDLAAQSQDNVLAASVTSILDATSIRNGQLNIDIPYSAFSMLGNVSEDRVFYAIRSNGDFLTGYEGLPIRRAEPGQPMGFATETFDGAEIRIAVAARSLSMQGAPVVVEAMVAQTREGLSATLNDISRSVGLFGLGFFVVVAALGFVTTQISLKPLDMLAGTISRRGPNDLRPVHGNVAGEMRPLVQSLNGFILRLKSSLSRSEDLIAEAAHRVRTPLAVVRAQAEVVLMRVEKQETRKDLREMIQAIDESSRAAGQLLDHAMVTFRTEQLQDKPVDYGRLLVEIVDRLQPTADLRDINIILASSLEGLEGRGDAILLQSAMLNILDNAIKYSPRDSDIHVSAGPDLNTGHAVISVSDAGKGFPVDAETELLADRFVRGSNTEGIVGSGLGLTIAREVAAAHGGFLKLENSKGRGACATLYFALH